jgi:hypothetical protein
MEQRSHVQADSHSAGQISVFMKPEVSQEPATKRCPVQFQTSARPHIIRFNIMLPHTPST